MHNSRNDDLLEFDDIVAVKKKERHKARRNRKNKLHFKRRDFQFKGRKANFRKRGNR